MIRLFQGKKNKLRCGGFVHRWLLWRPNEIKAVKFDHAQNDIFSPLPREHLSVVGHLREKCSIVRWLLIFIQTSPRSLVWCSVIQIRYYVLHFHDHRMSPGNNHQSWFLSPCCRHFWDPQCKYTHYYTYYIIPSNGRYVVTTSLSNVVGCE